MRVVEVVPFAAAALIVSTASAQTEGGGVFVPGVGVMTTSQLQEQIATLEHERDDIKLAGPRAGVGISSILVPSGIFLIIGGAALRSFEYTFLCPGGTRCGDPSAGSAVMIATGVAALIGGAVGLVMTSKKLKKRKAKRRRIERSIATLESAAPEFESRQ